MLAESRNCGPGSGVVGLVDEPPPKDDKKLLGTGSMAVRVVEFSNGVFKIRKIFA